MAWTSPRSWVAGETVTAALLNTHVRDNLKAIGDPWTAYTPTYTNFTLGNGTVTARYIQAGKLVTGSVKITLGTTSSVTGFWQVGLPVTAATTAAVVGSVYMNDASAAAHRTATAIVQTGGTQAVFLEAGGAGIVAAAVPFTWASGDILSLQFAYEAA